MSKGSNNEPSHQQTYHSIVPKNSHDNYTPSSSPMPQSSGTPSQPHAHANNATILSTTASALEDVVCSHLKYRGGTVADVVSVTSGDDDRVGEDEETTDDDYDPVQIFESDDAYMLRCRPVLTNDNGEEPARTIFGIEESAASLGSFDGKVSDGSSIPIRVTLLEPRCDDDINDEQKGQSKDLCYHQPRGNWTRQKESLANGQVPCPNDTANGGTQSSISRYHANVQIVDLTKIQNSRRIVGTTDEAYPCFDTPGRVFHLLRSVLNCSQNAKQCHSGGLHSASPWNEMYYCDKAATCNNIVPDGKDCAADQVVALLVKDPTEQREDMRDSVDDRFWDDIEQREINELLNFRTGDAAPSFSLHSSSQLSGGDQLMLDLSTHSKKVALIGGDETLDRNSCCSPSGALLLVYRNLPPRDVLSPYNFGHDGKCEYVGCLRETYFEQAEEDEIDTGSDSPTQDHQPVVKHRIISPPYQNHRSEYPGLLNELLKGITSIREEAQTIPQWTAWPEQKHYSDASWNVFPLCYTFPANDITQRKWVERTCSFVPETTNLLQTLGPTLRTALFSRLDPRARLGTHTGWSDLANHVLRVHIPVIVPGGNCASENKRNDSNYNTGLCGTWVDGCVETHEEGRVISFDDSKVHRAFNYSEEERIVLILDLLRPEGLPMGTATGGHSDELDAFINGF
eukprot:CAMPEP_0196135214 /NCGR_PEP_ID=MMETSP0910-20130528/3934_1 /TAXON_ID=49265 /ORGANISM="Thalassiosira rotula, Strain GSO102" /LENGTH=682 /DNA_ID=CAMNT_0041395325 /DNA_START=153 /DNA_END=2201 /DNA_ORIENTATION=+